MADSVIDRLEIKIIEANGLNTVNGMMPSAYAEILIGQEVKRTRQIAETCDPIWNTSTMIFNYLVANDADTLLCYVRHKDVFTGTDSVLGVAIIPLATVYGSPKVLIDDWFELSETTSMNEEARGSIHIHMTYFNNIDETVLMKPSVTTMQAPNLLEIKVSDANGFPGDKSIEAFVIIQVRDLKKQSRVSKRSNIPTWDEILHIPISDGNEMIDITVKQATALRNLFMGRTRISMNEVASFGETGISKTYNLYNENLQFDERGNGSIQMTLKWFFDQATDDENRRKNSPRFGIFSRIAAVLMPKKSDASKDDVSFSLIILL